MGGKVILNHRDFGLAKQREAYLKRKQYCKTPVNIYAKIYRISKQSKISRTVEPLFKN